MSGGGGGAGSLGQRSLSHGSLSTKDVLVSIHGNNVGLVLRKSIKGNIGRKERFLARVFKSAFRRRVRMFALLAAAITFCVLVFSNGRKEEVEHGSTDMDCRSTSCLQSQRLSSSIFSRYPKLLSTKEQDKKKVNTPSLPGGVAVRGENINRHSSNHAVGNSLPPGHPCENFSIPPPPADKKRTGPRPCPVCYLPVEEAILQMPHVSSLSPVLRNLTYVQEKTLNLTGWFGGSVFGGHPSLKQRSDSFDIKESMNVHCGFVRGDKPGMQSGFDIDNSDLVEMEQCQGVVVASAIFGNFDVIQQPKNISEIAKRSVCFFMFIDEETEADWRNSSILDDRMRVGLWRTVVVHNLPYVDPRRNGKVPKLLLHRLFPNVRYSIWIDGKLELVVDPYQILERFLWRKNATLAISRHYKRFDVFEEALANKVAGKYDNASIDFQVEFYKREGLTPYSEAKLPITSDVPEGCVIIKEHIPITNLFTCLWFNEVDRFTPRDQISFSTVRDNIMSKVNWSMNMFMDCERRNFVVQKYHRDLLIKMSPPVGNKTHHPPPHKPLTKSSAEAATDPFLRLWKKSNGRERKSGLQQHHNQDIAKRRV